MGKEKTFKQEMYDHLVKKFGKEQSLNDSLMRYIDMLEKNLEVQKHLVKELLEEIKQLRGQ